MQNFQVIYLVFLGDNVAGGFAPGTLLSKYINAHDATDHDTPLIDGHRKWLKFSDSQCNANWIFGSIATPISTITKANGLPAVTCATFMLNFLFKQNVS